MKIKYDIHKIHDSGEIFSVFLSHASADKSWNTIVPELRDKGKILCISDTKLQPGDREFAQTITRMIKENDVFVLLLADGKLTEWMFFELGLAAGFEKKIVIFSQKPVEESTNYFFRRYGPVITDVDVLIHEIHNSYFFSELFEQETAQLTKSSFLNACMADIDVCTLSFPVPGLQQIPAGVYRFGYILLSMARYEKLGETARNKVICNRTGDPITDGKCNIDGHLCGLCEEQSFTGATDVILNKILYNCRYSPEDMYLHTVLPVHQKRGVTFKCFVDVTNSDYLEDIMACLRSAGIPAENITPSDSAVGNRVYFLLPKSALRGLFTAETPEGFFNNYLCKGALV